MSALEKRGREIRLERLKILRRYIQNNRIAEYEDILAKARDHGYQMLTLENYAKGDYDKGKKVLLLRHDVDHISPGTRAMLNAEQKYGEEENGMVGVSNNYLTDDDSVYGDLGIVLESYQQKFIESMGIYISDTVMEYNGGYRYGITPQEAIADGISPILFLSHPNHWKYTHRGQFRKIVKSIIKSPIRTKENFKRIAK